MSYIYPGRESGSVALIAPGCNVRVVVPELEAGVAGLAIEVMGFGGIEGVEDRLFAYTMGFTDFDPERSYESFVIATDASTVPLSPTALPRSARLDVFCPLRTPNGPVDPDQARAAASLDTNLTAVVELSSTPALQYAVGPLLERVEIDCRHLLYCIHPEDEAVTEEGIRRSALLDRHHGETGGDA